MRHRKDTSKLGRTSSHRRCMIANMLKSLIVNDRIVTSVAKAKELRRHADKMITIAKKNDTLTAKRDAIAKLMVRFNTLTTKESRDAKEGKPVPFNDDRLVINKLFDTLGPRFANRVGGYTRLVKGNNRVGDNSQQCIIEFLAE